VRNIFSSAKRDGPLIKGSRDSVTAANCFAALIFWFVLHQGKMNKKPFKIEKYFYDLLTKFPVETCFPNQLIV